MSTMESGRLHIGLVLPTSEGMLNGGTPCWSDIAAQAQLAEAVGFDGLWLVDHLLIPVGQWLPGAEPMGSWECWSLLSALAAVTKRVTLGTLTTCTQFRNPALLAKMADTADEISGGRLIVGLGAGSVVEEFAAFGYPADHRVGHFEEALQIICGLLRDGEIDFHGRYYQASECQLRPRGPRHGGPPVLVGARGPRMDRLAARYADSWNAAWPNRAEWLRPRLMAIDEACAEVGRDPLSLKRTVGVMIDAPGIKRDQRWAWGKVVRTPAKPLSGSVEEISAELEAYHRLGVSQVQAMLDPCSPQAVEAFAPVLELVSNRALTA